MAAWTDNPPRAGRKPRDLRKARRSWGKSTATPEQVEAKRTERRELSQSRADDALSQVLTLFESGDLPSLVARTWIARAEGESPMVNWSLGNQLLALLAGTTDARGFRQWQEVGRDVVKGARAFYILGPSTRKIHDDETDEDRTIVMGFHPIPVFRFEDTDGYPLTTPDYSPPEPPPLAGVAARWGLDVRYVPMIGQSWAGMYQPFGERITLATHEARTFFHELAHAAHARVLKAAGREFKTGQVASQEIVAELTAAVLGHLHGCSLGETVYSREYISAYAKGKSAASACMGVLNDVQACLRAILEVE